MSRKLTVPASITETAKKLVGPQIVRVKSLLREQVQAAHPSARRVLKGAAIGKGKLLRPAMLLLAGRAVGDVGESHCQAAAAVELLHLASLVHDDIIDQATLRRFQPALNAIWGDSISLLAGDFLFSSAFTLMPGLDSRRCHEIFAEATRALCQGELRQIMDGRRPDLSEKEYLDIIADKTGVLFRAAAEAGAELSGASKATARRFRNYGHYFGLAFQVLDDCLDLAASEDRTGKTAGTDAQEGRTTLPVIRLLAGAGRREKKEILQILDAGPTRRGEQELRRRIRESGALAATQVQAAELARQAAKQLAPIPPSKAKDVLVGLTEYLAERYR